MTQDHGIESPAETIARLERRAARERAARLEAELIAESQLRRSYERSREVELFAQIAVLVNESRDALTALGAAAKVLRRHCDFAVSHVLVPDNDGAFVTADIWDADVAARRREIDALVFDGVALPLFSIVVPYPDGPHTHL